MPALYAPHRPQSRTLDPSLSAVADAVAECIDDLGVRRAGKVIGASKSSASKWKSDLMELPTKCFLSLVRKSKEVRDAVMQFATEEPATIPQPTAAIPEAAETIRLCADLTNELVGIVHAGKCKHPDGRRIDAKIEGLISQLTNLKRDVRAAARRQSP